MDTALIVFHVMYTELNETEVDVIINHQVLGVLSMDGNATGRTTAATERRCLSRSDLGKKDMHTTDNRVLHIHHSKQGR
jgi:hypothetical protein